MKTRSCKAKGRRLQNLVRDKLLATVFYPPRPSSLPGPQLLASDDVRVAIMGEGGVDIKLSPLAQTYVPFDIECKNTENASPWAWIAQAEANAKQGRTPLVVFKRNSSKVYAIIEFDRLLEITRRSS